MSGLFPAADRFERIPMPDAEVYYLNELELRLPHDAVLGQLIADVPWRKENVVVWGKMFPQPRLVAWYGDRGADYTYSGITLSPLPWSDLLLEIRRRVETVAAAAFNSCCSTITVTIETAWDFIAMMNQSWAIGP